jgi:hypothetical protein
MEDGGSRDDAIFDPRSSIFDRMRLAYFTLLPPSKSGIADYNFELLPYLAKGAEISVFVEEAMARWTILTVYLTHRSNLRMEFYTGWIGFSLRPLQTDRCSKEDYATVYLDRTYPCPIFHCFHSSPTKRIRHNHQKRRGL